MHAPTLASKAILLTSSHPFLPTWRVKSNKIYKVVLTRRDKHPATEVLFGYATESYQCLAPVWPRDCFQCFPDSFLHKQTKVWEKRTCSRFDLKLWLPPASEYILHHLHISFVNITGTLSKTINVLILELRFHSLGNRSDHSIEETTYSRFPPYKMRFCVSSPSQQMDNSKEPFKGPGKLKGERNTCERQILRGSLGADDLKAKDKGGILCSDRHEEVSKSDRHRWSLGKHGWYHPSWLTYMTLQIRPIPIWLSSTSPHLLNALQLKACAHFYFPLAFSNHHILSQNINQKWQIHTLYHGIDHLWDLHTVTLKIKMILLAIGWCAAREEG